MWSPLLRILLREPGLLAGHVCAYAELIGQDAARWRAHQLRRLGCLLTLAVAAVLALLFAGVALMLHAATGSGHWLLWAVPAGALLLALAAGLACLRTRPPAPAFSRVRTQMAEDLELFGLKEPP